MNIFGLDGVGLLLTLAMSLLISGLIMFYSLRRFKMLENSIVEQGKVLQSFILKSQNQIEHGLASPIAVDSAIVQSETNRMMIIRRMTIQRMTILTMTILRMSQKTSRMRMNQLKK